MYHIGAGIYSRYTKEELKDFLKELDLVMVDLDECIFPGITKVTLYKNICLLLIRRRHLKDYILLVRLLTGAVMIALINLVQKLCPGMTNRRLILYFAKVIKSVPVPYLQEAVRSIPSKSYAGARQTLEILSKKAKVGIISQGLDIVLDEYARQFTDTQGSIIDFWDGNTLSSLCNSRKSRVTDNIFIFKPDDKEATARKRIAQFGSRKIMVIGHNTDDLGMMAIAKKHKGIIVGFNPTKNVRELCDIVIRGKNWIDFRQIVQELVEPGES